MLNESSLRGVMRIKNCCDSSSTPGFGKEDAIKQPGHMENDLICNQLTEPQEIDFHLTTGINI